MAVTSRPGSASASPGITDIDEVQDRTFGFTAATMIGGGFGVALFGALTLISELFASSTKATMTLVTPVGPLSGKSIFAVAGWLLGWAVLAVVLRGRNVSEGATYWITGILIAIGFVLTFPPTWKLLGT